MANELELLKQDWKKRAASIPQLGKDEIQALLGRRSRSLVRWILSISILEFALPHLLYVIPGVQENWRMYKELGLYKPFVVLSIAGYSVAFYFIYQFYKRYRAISVAVSSKQLIQQILNVRKTVKHYIISAFGLAVTMVVMTLVAMILHPNLASVFPPETEAASTLSAEKYRSILLWGMSIGMVIILGTLAVFYYLAYGISLRKLKKNYTELQHLEL